MLETRNQSFLNEATNRTIRRIYTPHYVTVSEPYGGKINGLKRNIKKKNNVSLKNTTCTKNSLVQSSDFVTSCNLWKYKYPHYDKVKSGYYFSTIVYVQEAKTKSGSDAIEVFYEIQPDSTCYKIATSQIDETDANDTSYIIQKYPLNSTYYQEFKYSMSNALGNSDFELADVLGITEYISLTYEDSDIGGISKRKAITWDKLKEHCIQDYEEYLETQRECAEAKAKAEAEAKKENNVHKSNESDKSSKADFDDEFDDFLDDDDEFDW